MRRLKLGANFLVSVIASGILLSIGTGLAGTAQAAGRSSGPVVGPPALVSASPNCPAGSAEVVTAADQARSKFYEEWICRGGGIGFTRSVDGGKTLSAGIVLPRSAYGWDPAVAVAPDGTVYASFMVDRNNVRYPVVDVSHDNGQTFRVAALLKPAGTHNWGDRDFIAVGPRGAIYLTWDYAPVDDVASFKSGELNVVLQKSTDGGTTWSKIIPISPGYPASGADSAPILVEPGGRLDVLYQAYRVLNRQTLALGPAHEYFTTSTDLGRRWSRPVLIGPASLSMSNAEWWIDGSLGRDAGGNLYATWDTQSGGRDVAWLAFSRDGGRAWSRLVRVTPDNDQAMHLVQVAGGAAGIAYVGWLTNSSPRGYIQYLRAFSVGRGWLSPAVRVSPRAGSAGIWPGDTIGLTVLPGGAAGSRQVAVSYGGAIGVQPHSQIWAVVVSHLP